MSRPLSPLFANPCSGHERIARLNSGQCIVNGVWELLIHRKTAVSQITQTRAGVPRAFDTAYTNLGPTLP